MLRRLATYLSLTCLFLSSLVLVPFIPKAQAQSSDGTVTSKLAPEFQFDQSGSTGGDSTGTHQGDTGDGTSPKVRVIIQTKGQPSAAQDVAILSQGGTKSASFDALNTVVAEVPLNSLATLAARDDVAYISPDRPLKTQNLTSDITGASQVQAGLSQMPGFTGKNITIAIIDSGISAGHPDFSKNNNKSRILTSVDFTGSTRSGDPYGHGTGVASVAAGNGSASRGYASNYAGLAPDANLIDLRVIDESGIGRTSSTLSAINWIIQNKDRYNIRVANMSLGGAIRESYKTDPLCQAVAQAVRAGVVVVCSAGNYGHTTEITGYTSQGKPIYKLAYGTITSPANSPYVITVGATDSRGTLQRSDDTVADYSSKGPTQIDHQAKPDIVAPGTRIIAALSQEPNPVFPGLVPQNLQQPTSADARPNSYFKYSGTSFAAPVVAGTVALMLEANQSLTPRLVKAALLRTAQVLPGVQFGSKAQSILTQGAGQLNVVGAVEMARAIVPNADKLAIGDNIFLPNRTLSTLGQATIGGESIEFNGHVSYSDGILFTNHPVLTAGIMLMDGLIMRDGIITTGGTIMTDGIMLMDGYILASTIIMTDGIMLMDGYILASGIVMTEGYILASGTLVITGGIMLMDGYILASGIVMTDGYILASGIIMSDGYVIGSDAPLPNGYILASGALLSD